MLPPPAPMLWISSTGIPTIRSCSSSSSRLVDARPWATTATSVLVPPMSKPTRFGNPSRREYISAPITPPTGPLLSVVTGLAIACSGAIRPPSLVMNFNGALWPDASRRSSSAEV